MTWAKTLLHESRHQGGKPHDAKAAHLKSDRRHDDLKRVESL